MKSRKPKIQTPPKIPATQYGPTFFLTADSDTAPAFEIDGTPHTRTIANYRSEDANIIEYEEQDGKILYKIKLLSNRTSHS